MIRRLFLILPVSVSGTVFKIHIYILPSINYQEWKKLDGVSLAAEMLLK